MRGAAVARSVFGAGVLLRTVDVAEIPGRAGFDDLVAANAASEAGCDEGRENATTPTVRYSVAVILQRSGALRAPGRVSG